VVCVLVWWCPKRQPIPRQIRLGKQEITRDLPSDGAVAFEISRNNDPWIHAPCYLEKHKTQ